MSLQRTAHQKLPPTGKAREALREKGQFWTPQWVAEAMVAYVLRGGAQYIFDPAVGAGAFFKAAKRVTEKEGRTVDLLGTEIDPESLRQAQETGLTAHDLRRVEIRDFVVNPPARSFDAVVANPPYLRHHRLSEDTKHFLRHFGASLIGKPLDGRAGYHVYFFLRGLRALTKGGRLAFILPADICEGVFAHTLWHWVLGHYCLDAVITFAPEATPFPSVDTNAIVFMLRNEEPKESFPWARCLIPEDPSLGRWVASGFKQRNGLEIHIRAIEEGLRTGLSRSPLQHVRGPVLGDFATVLRGIATGANEFFFLTKERAKELNIPEECLIPAVGRTRDVPEEAITTDTLRRLDMEGRPTLLLSLDATPPEKLPESVRTYIAHGEMMRLDDRSLIATRKPWYKMEVRNPPPFLFAYLGRRNARFIKNLAGVVPLTGFLCIYPLHSGADSIERLWRVLRDPETIANLPRVGKSYGAGAIKVEPRALERLPISLSVLERAGLQWRQSPEQMELAV